MLTLLRIVKYTEIQKRHFFFNRKEKQTLNFLGTENGTDCFQIVREMIKNGEHFFKKKMNFRQNSQNLNLKNAKRHS